MNTAVRTAAKVAVRCVVSAVAIFGVVDRHAQVGKNGNVPVLLRALGSIACRSDRQPADQSSCR